MTGKAERGGAAPSSGAAPARRRGLSLSSRLAATVLGVGLTSLAGATLVGLNAGESLGRSIVDDGLESLRSSGSTDVAAQLGFYERLAEQLAASPQTTASIEGFASALAELSSTPDDESRLQRQELIEGFRDQYIEPAREEGEVVQLREILSDDPAAVYLQAAYSLPDGPIREPIAVDDAGDGSAWTDLHSVVHPVYRNAVLQAGLLDILLVDLTSGRIVYSASKAPDLGTSLAVGPYSGSIVARATDAEGRFARRTLRRDRHRPQLLPRPARRPSRGCCGPGARRGSARRSRRPHLRRWCVHRASELPGRRGEEYRRGRGRPRDVPDRCWRHDAQRSPVIPRRSAGLPGRIDG